MARLLGLDFAPLEVPLERRLQMGMVLFYHFLFFCTTFTSLFLFVLLFTSLFWIPLGYGIWVYYDSILCDISSRGGRRWMWFRECVIWNYFRDYFPCKLIKTTDLDPDKNYLFGCHPHGIIGCGAWANFATESTKFSKLFAGLKPHILTLKPNFCWPALREVILWLGFCDVSKGSINWILTKQGTGNAAIVVVGGAEEALSARTGKYDIILKKRKGFVKLAIKAGACLVPVFMFGENDVFAQFPNPRGSWIRQFQNWFKKIVGFSPPFFYGRGVFNYTFGMVPFRKPINTVVGQPIETKYCLDPSPEQVDEVHQRYMEELAQLFDQHKTQFGVPKDKSLNFI